MTDFIEIYDNALSSDMCDYTVEMIDKLPKRKVDEKGRKDVFYVEDTFLVEPSPYTVAINNALCKCVNKYTEKHHQLKTVINYYLQKDLSLTYQQMHYQI